MVTKKHLTIGAVLLLIIATPLDEMLIAALFGKNILILFLIGLGLYWILKR